LSPLLLLLFGFSSHSGRETNPKKKRQKKKKKIPKTDNKSEPIFFEEKSTLVPVENQTKKDDGQLCSADLGID
jgi:hypothetical protein